MATLTRGQSFGASETVTNTKLHNLVDNATISNITDADIASNAAIQFSKLLASSISGALFTNLPLIPSAAGLIPFANIPVPFGSTYVSLVTIPNQSLQPLTLASWVDGVALRNLASTPVDRQVRYNLLVSSLASGGVPSYDGANNFVGRNITQHMTLAVAATGEDATDTGRIAIAASKQYYVTFDFIPAPTTADYNLFLRFYNSGSKLTGASDYSWARRTILMHTTPTATDAGDNADSEIELGQVGSPTDEGQVRGFMHITTYTYAGGTNTFVTSVTGQFTKVNGVGGRERVDFSGVVVGSYTINGFGFERDTGDAAFDYRINVYELAQAI